MSKLIIPFQFGDFAHPSHRTGIDDWVKWRLAYEGGRSFVHQYLKKLGEREEEADYQLRRDYITATATYAKSAINDIKNQIFQRLSDVSRVNGSEAYEKAVAGEAGGVDKKGLSMNAFLGQRVLPELLVMGKVGIYVDMPSEINPTALNANNARPYLYMYPREQIVNWIPAGPDEPHQFKAVLLQDTIFESDEADEFGFPIKETTRLRLVFLDEETGFVKVRFMDVNKNVTREVELTGLTKIPFILLDLGDSIMKDIAHHQITILNIQSSYLHAQWKSGFAIYTEQGDKNDFGGWSKGPGDEDNSNNRKITVGVTKGVRYPMGADRPGFIHAASEPIESGQNVKNDLESEIRRLVNLAVRRVGQQSAESQSADNQGLEAGLSFIGSVLEAAEQQIAEAWAGYEHVEPNSRSVATVSYPSRWELKSDEQRLNDALKALELGRQFTSERAQRESLKLAAHTWYIGRVPANVLDEILKQIDEAPYTISDPEIVTKLFAEGLVSPETATISVGYKTDEANKAEEAHVRRLERIKVSQESGSASGVRDEFMNASQADRARKTDTEEDTDGTER